jgi:hypothetical protein
MMTVTRQEAILNFWLNQPAILDAVAPGFETIDASAFFDNPRNVMLEHPHGIAVFFYKGAGVYDGHYLFGPNLRGKAAIEVAKSMLSTLFTSYGALTILGQTPRENRPARMVTRALGFLPYGNGSVDTFNRPCVDYVLTRERWEQLPWAEKKA